MVKRNGWVSNSSSSSFIISTKENTSLKVMVEMDLAKCTDKTIKTKEEAKKFIMEEHGWGDRSFEEVLAGEEYVEETYSSMLKAIDAGDIVYMLSGSSDDYGNPTGTYLYSNGLKGLQNINIIEDGD